MLSKDVVASFAPALEDRAEAGNPHGEHNGTIVDLTCGGGGHSALMLEAFAPARHLVLDRDPQALAHAEPALRDLAARSETELVLHHGRFSEVGQVLAQLQRQDPAWARPNVVFADIGVSSHQLDHGPRGFSFRQQAPLDMRMDPTRGETAADLLASLDAPALARILKELGQEPDAPRIARAICARPPTTTTELAELVTQAMSAVGRRKLGKRVHPATRTFQALRIAVNGELEELDALLRDGPAHLAPGGRLGIITFHSLEDAKVKRRFRDLSRVERPPASLPIMDADLPKPQFVLPATYGKGVDASAAEIEQNPRARSARLRVLQRREDA